MSSWWLFHRPFSLYTNSVGRLKNGHEFGLMAMTFVSDSEKMETVQDFHNVFDVTTRNPREIARNEAMYVGKRL